MIKVSWKPIIIEVSLNSVIIEVTLFIPVMEVNNNRGYALYSSHGG